VEHRHAADVELVQPPGIADRALAAADQVGCDDLQRDEEDLLSLPWVVSPSRKWRAESAEREHGEGDDGFL